MSNRQPKLRKEPKRDEQGNLRKDFRKTGVEPDYNFSDWQSQAKSLKTYAAIWNQMCINEGRDFDCIDPEKIVRTMIKKVARHNGLLSKYDGAGNLRDTPV